MNKLIRHFALVCVLSVLTSCASSPDRAASEQAKEMASLREKALKHYHAGRFNAAAKAWTKIYDQGLFSNNAKLTARAAYHLGMCAWSQEQYVEAYSHFLVADRFQSRTEESNPNITLMLVQADWMVHQKAKALHSLRVMLDKPRVDVDVKLQAMLLLAEAHQAGVFVDAVEVDMDTQLAEVEKLYPKAKSGSLKRHIQHLLAERAVKGGLWNAAAAHLQEARTLAEDINNPSWVALHTYEVARVAEQQFDDQRFVDQGLLSATMWVALENYQAAYLVLQNVRTKVQSSGSDKDQKLLIQLDEQCENRLGDGVKSGDLSSIIIRACNESKE